MKKTFLLGLVLGIGGAVWLAGWYPFVDPDRFPSESSVARNGGRTETFQVYLPEDRLGRVSTMPGTAGATPAGLSAPAGAGLGDVDAELFKLRNASGTIIGVAGRIQRGEASTGYADWTLVLPARGAMFLSAAGAPPPPYQGLPEDVSLAEPVAVLGDVVGGSREFAELGGSFREEWRYTGRDADGRLAGRIEIMTLTQEARP